MVLQIKNMKDGKTALKMLWKTLCEKYIFMPIMKSIYGWKMSVERLLIYTIK